DLSGGLLVGPVQISPAADSPTDFSVVRNGTNGTAFGVVYRRQDLSRNNLYFRSVAVDGSTVSTEQIVTSALDTNPDLHPTIVWLDGVNGNMYDPGTGAVFAPY